jgi:hypothetical protein
VAGSIDFVAYLSEGGIAVVGLGIWGVRASRMSVNLLDTLLVVHPGRSRWRASTSQLSSRGVV